MEQLNKFITIPFKIVASLFLLRLGIGLAYVIGLTFNTWVLVIIGWIALIPLVIQFWNSNDKLWPIIWKGFIFWIAFHFLRLFFEVGYAVFDVIV